MVLVNCLHVAIFATYSDRSLICAWKTIGWFDASLSGLKDLVLLFKVNDGRQRYIATHPKNDTA